MNGIEVLIFDVFGTVVDWRTSVVNELSDLGKRLNLGEGDAGWHEFAAEWRAGYMRTTVGVARGTPGVDGPPNVDVLHRQILDEMLTSSRWSHIGSRLSEKERVHLNLVWHRLGAWEETVGEIKSRNESDNGQVDFVFKSFTELAEMSN